jgi:hypothetical protein
MVGVEDQNRIVQPLLRRETVVQRSDKEVSLPSMGERVNVKLPRPLYFVPSFGH